MKPKEKGDLAVAHAIFYFQRNGYEVCLPIGDKRPYDLIIEFGGKLSKVQVKYTSFQSPSSRYRAALRIMGGNQSYGYAKKYKDDDFDLLFIYTANGDKYLIPWPKIVNRNNITVGPGKYEMYKVK